MYDKNIVGRIWSNYGDLAIIRDFNPATRGEEYQLEKAIRETRAVIKDLVRDLPGIIEAALREGFTTSQVFDVVREKGQDLIPPFDLACLISNAQTKINAKKQAAHDVVDEAE